MSTYTRCNKDIRSFFAERKCTLFSRATLHIYPAYGNWLKFAQDPNTFSLLYAKVVRALHSSSGKVVWYTILYCGCQWQAQSNILSEQLFWSRVHFFFLPFTLSLSTALQTVDHILWPILAFIRGDVKQRSKNLGLWKTFVNYLVYFLGTKLLKNCF